MSVNCIVKLHGTSGSGKTTVARGLLNLGSVAPLPKLRTRASGYCVIVPNLVRSLYVLGPYDAVCGGLDSLSNVEDHIALLTEYAPLGHVFYEGLLQSEYYGRIGKVSEQYNDDHIFAFLDTPAEVCVERVMARRLARGNSKPFDPSNTVGRVAKIARVRHRLETEFFRKTATIRHEYALQDVLDLYINWERSRGLYPA